MRAILRDRSGMADGSGLLYGIIAIVLGFFVIVSLVLVFQQHPSAPARVRLTAPVTRITDTTKSEGYGTCSARNFQFANGSLVSLSTCNNPWVTAVRVGDRLKKQSGSYIGFNK